MMKVDTWVLLQKDFTIEKYLGFILDTQFNEDFRAIEINERDKFVQKIVSHKGAILLNEKYKENFIPFMVKHLQITGHNMLCYPVVDNEIGTIGLLIFANKQVEKERKHFDK